MTDAFLDASALASFSADEFQARRPFPWHAFQSLLRPEAFDLLHAEFPPLSMFEWHEDRERNYGQRPHNRYYLAYQSPQYSGYPGRAKDEFPEPWQAFLTELETSAVYLEFLERSLWHTNLRFRYTFHIVVTGSEVSPHCDKGRKAGTHIFYFNTEDDWDPSWGGATLLLDGKRTADSAPGFEDFAEATPIEHVGNASFLFRNTDEAWHGVRPITSPPGAYRRIFNVVAEMADWRPPTRPSLVRRVRTRVRRTARRR